MITIFSRLAASAGPMWIEARTWVDWYRDSHGRLQPSWVGIGTWLCWGILIVFIVKAVVDELRHAGSGRHQGGVK